MRIRSGGPGRASKASGAQGAGKAGKAQGARFSGLIQGDPQDTEEAARQIRSQLLDELAELAKDIEAGKSSNEEASRKFAGLVIKERFGEQDKTQGGEAMVDAIGEMVENDPNFVSRLGAQLKKLSKS